MSLGDRGQAVKPARIPLNESANDSWYGSQESWSSQGGKYLSLYTLAKN